MVRSDKKLIKKLLGSRIFLIFTILILIWFAVSLGHESYRKYQLSKEINNLKSEIERLEGGNQDLANLIEYFKQESYLEKEARLKLNLKKPGEQVVIIPQADSEVLLKEEDTQEELSFFIDEASELEEETNYWKWWRYFFK